MRIVCVRHQFLLYFCVVKVSGGYEMSLAMCSGRGWDIGRSGDVRLEPWKVLIEKYSLFQK
jgi:hypothetical protein